MSRRASRAEAGGRDARSRVAGPDEGIGVDELGLATRNHGLLLEALRYDVTPVGLHYLLTHYDVPFIDPRQWRLQIGGAVAAPTVLSLADLMARPSVTQRVTLECAGNGRALLRPRPVSQPWLVEAVGTAEWTGTPLAPLLREVGIASDVVDVAFTGADHGTERGVEQDYARGLPVAEALREDVLLVWGMNGGLLPPQHGAPVRLLVPGWYGMAQVKWLVRVDVLEREFRGFQNALAYRLAGPEPLDRGEPVTRMRPRALVVPPGFPDFMSRRRVLRAGPCVVVGRAWTGRPPVTAVEVSTNGGATWSPAHLDEPDSAHPYAWQRFEVEWDATPGEYELCARAGDVSGAVQPVEQRWNRQGMANNVVQRVPVEVLPSQ